VRIEGDGWCGGLLHFVFWFEGSACSMRGRVGCQDGWRGVQPPEELACKAGTL
jgi:hypothetical protein